MKFNFKRITAAATALLITGVSGIVPDLGTPELTAQAKYGTGNNVVEYLDRGITAVNTGSGMLVSWRFLANDDDNTVFRLYRDDTLVYTSNAGDATCYLDAGGTASSTYKVETLAGGVVKSTDTCTMTSSGAYFDVKLNRPSSIYSPNDCSVGDVDGDGQYELFVKWDPNNSKDNSQSGKTDKVYIDCYRFDGTQLWRIDLGYNIRAGAHYTQFLVGDFDLDGKAEMTCKTGDGTVDGVGNVIGDASASYRNSDGQIITGPEYYSLFDGETGAVLDTVNYEPARGSASGWGDSYGGRCERYLGAVMYIDGVTPCPVTVRGYYTRMTACAYRVENDKLVKQWLFDTGTSSSANGYGDGNHNCMPADVDNDGCQELIMGSACIDHDGDILWNLNKGHGDAMHVGDLVPENNGLEAWLCHEEKPYGVTLVDCDTGKQIFHVDASGDTGRCCADNVWSGNNGGEFWGPDTVYNGAGAGLSMSRPRVNFLSHWDGDLEREILDGYTDTHATIYDVNDAGKQVTILTTDGYYTCNTTKGTPCLSADIFGDWREELIVRAADGNSVRIFATTYDTDYRITTLMHDVQYRTQVAGQNVAYNQPPHTSFYLGSDRSLPERPAVTIGTASGKRGAVIDTAHKYKIKNSNSGLYMEVADGAAANGTNVQQGNSDYNGWTFESAGGGYYYVYSELGDGRTYLLDLDYGKVDNGTNIGIWGNTQSDAQLFKFVDNGDGTYTICTKPTADESCLGIANGSADNGANVLQWACDGTANQKWILEIKVDSLDGKLFKDVMRLDMDNYMNWSISPSTATGGLIFGDRDFTFTSLPAEIDGAESLLTACDSKYTTSDLATFTAGADMAVYVLMDSRVTPLPSWLSDWENTGLTAASSNDVTFNAYRLEVKSGEKVTLGQNGQSASCVNYVVFGKAADEVGTIEPTTEPETVPPATEPVESGIVWGDANLSGDVEIADAIAIMAYVTNAETYPLSAEAKRNADVYQNGDGVAVTDAVSVQKYLTKLISVLPES
ncbi:MAG: rhamnogalacturonan lyase [Ruminococcus sp.]|nr:rhamnogalacturonan lyase [Ruminococcus sp.]